MGDSQAILRSEVIGLIIKLALLTGVTFFSVRWMITRLDPTHKQKKSAKRKVGYLLFSSLGDIYCILASCYIHLTLNICSFVRQCNTFTSQILLRHVSASHGHPQLL
jgi:hypothetical protein